jgi:hypothetical protein
MALSTPGESLNNNKCELFKVYPTVRDMQPLKETETVRRLSGHK